MADSTTSERDELLAFELALDEQVCDEVRPESWGRLFLTPSLPLIWDASALVLEREGMALEEVLGLADEALGGAGFAHRTVAVAGEADGRRLGEQLEAQGARWPDWEGQRIRHMVWRGYEAGAPAPEAREVRLAEIEELRQAILAAEALPPGAAEPEATLEQLYAMESRYGAAAGDRWFVAPAAGEPLSCCRLLQTGPIAQVEDVGTLERARERGYGKAIVRAAIAAAQASGTTTIFLTADAADWPQLMYAKLGFEPVGDLAILRRRP